MNAGPIRVGIGGWTFAPWRGTFYPEGLPHARELAHASERVTAIEINSTYHGTQKPESFAKWHDATPGHFMFSVKASRYATNRTKLAEAGESVERFLGQGLTRLGDKLGPILWQFMPTKRFDPEDFAGFLKLLPAERDGVKLRHALEVRHESFADPAFVEMARGAGAAIVFADGKDRPVIADPTADFVYARLQDAREDEPAGYDARALGRWAKIAKAWAAGDTPGDLPLAAPPAKERARRDVFVFFINGAKVRAPAAAEALIARLGD